jgi:outer membrane protein TolC
MILAIAAFAPPALGQEPSEPEPIAKVKPPTTAELAAKLEQLLGKPAGLTAATAAARATATSPTVRARETRIAVADEEKTQAIIGFVPRATFTARYTRLSPVDAQSLGSENSSLVGTLAPPGPLAAGTPLLALPPDAFSFPVLLNNTLLQASILVPITDIPLRALQNFQAAKHDRTAAELEVKVASRNAAANAKIAYWEWVRLSMSRVVAEQTLVQSNVQLDATRALEEAGKASPADVLQAKARVSQAKQLLDRATHASGSALDRLRTMMHDDRRTDYAIGENPTTAVAPSAPAPLADLYGEALRNRLELTALDEQSRALLRQRQAATAAAYPSLSAFANFTFANPNQRVFPQRDEFKGTWDIGVQLTWSPNDVPASLSAADTIGARKRELDARRDELADAIESEVREADVALRDAQAALDNTETGVAAAEEAYRIRVERFRYGRATQVELAESETALLRARLERIEAQVGIRAARVRLDHALGR